MKRLIMIVTVCIIFCLCTACGKSSGISARAEQKLSGSFSADFTVELDDFTAEGMLTRYDSGIWSVYFESPAEVSGIQLDFSGDEVSASYKGLSFSVPQSVLPSKALLLQMIRAVDDTASEETINGSKKDDLIEIEGELEGEPYLLFLNSDGSLAEFRMDNMGGYIEFSDFTSEIKMTTTATTVESLIITTSDTIERNNES